ncbi:MAG: mechanosensitive ion channel family protein [Spirochaetia bacterium]|nr:mechanosensitive ion channel family protein [Spirochaetia bacterium]
MKEVYSKKTFIELWDQSIANLWHALPSLLPKILYTVILIIIIGLIKTFILKVMVKRVHDSTARLQWQRTIGYIFFFLSILILLPIWLPSLHSVATFLGIFGAGVLIVFKEVFLNIAGWVFILSRKPFVPGNRIQIDDAIGDVLDQRIISFSMIEVKPRSEGGQSTGRIIHVPNSKIFTDLVHNASKDFALNWNEIYVYLSANSDWKKAVELLEKIAETTLEKINPDDKRLKDAEKNFAIKYKKINPSVYVDVDENKIRLTIRHLTDPLKTRFITDKLWRSILEEFSQVENINFLENE